MLSFNAHRVKMATCSPGACPASVLAAARLLGRLQGADTDISLTADETDWKCYASALALASAGNSGSNQDVGNLIQLGLLLCPVAPDPGQGLTVDSTNSIKIALPVLLDVCARSSGEVAVSASALVMVAAEYTALSIQSREGVVSSGLSMPSLALAGMLTRSLASMLVNARLEVPDWQSLPSAPVSDDLKPPELPGTPDAGLSEQAAPSSCSAAATVGSATARLVRAGLLDCLRFTDDGPVSMSDRYSATVCECIRRLGACGVSLLGTAHAGCVVAGASLLDAVPHEWFLLALPKPGVSYSRAITTPTLERLSITHSATASAHSGSAWDTEAAHGITMVLGASAAPRSDRITVFSAAWRLCRCMGLGWLTSPSQKSPKHSASAGAAAAVGAAAGADVPASDSQGPDSSPEQSSIDTALQSASGLIVVMGSAVAELKLCLDAAVENLAQKAPPRNDESMQSHGTSAGSSKKELASENESSARAVSATTSGSSMAGGGIGSTPPPLESDSDTDDDDEDDHSPMMPPSVSSSVDSCRKRQPDDHDAPAQPTKQHLVVPLQSRSTRSRRACHHYGQWENCAARAAELIAMLCQTLPASLSDRDTGDTADTADIGFPTEILSAGVLSRLRIILHGAAEVCAAFLEELHSGELGLLMFRGAEPSVCTGPTGDDDLTWRANLIAPFADTAAWLLCRVLSEDEGAAEELTAVALARIASLHPIVPRMSRQDDTVSLLGAISGHEGDAIPTTVFAPGCLGLSYHAWSQLCLAASQPSSSSPFSSQARDQLPEVPAPRSDMRVCPPSELFSPVRHAASVLTSVCIDAVAQHDLGSSSDDDEAAAMAETSSSRVDTSVLELFGLVAIASSEQSQTGGKPPLESAVDTRLASDLLPCCRALVLALNDVAHSITAGVDVEQSPVPAIVTALGWEISSRAVATQAALPVMLRTSGSSRVAVASLLALQMCELSCRLEKAIRRLPSCTGPATVNCLACAVGVDAAVAAVIVALPARLVSLSAALAAALPIAHRVAMLSSREGLMAREILKALSGGIAETDSGPDGAGLGLSDVEETGARACRGMQAAALADLIRVWPQILEDDALAADSDTIVALRGLFTSAIDPLSASECLLRARLQADALGIRPHLENIIPSLTGLLRPE